MLTRADVERIIENRLKEDLKVKVYTSQYTGPNIRTIDLMYKDEVISSTYFDIEDREEYY